LDEEPWEVHLPRQAYIGIVPGFGKGSGIGLMFVLLGILATVAASSGFLSPRLRNVEDELPDGE